MRLVFFLLLFLLSLSSTAQPARSYTSSEIYQKLKKLNVLGSVLYVAAHPDDENTRLIAYLSNEKLYRTAYLSLTRGDGGQNLIGNEQGVDLGLIRTQELLAARRVDGGEQFFSRAFDFGYSKTPEETLEIWDKDKILSDVVWVIRKFRPDVIITRFPTTGEGGHGHHTASALLAVEAFEAAADSTKFPEQFAFGVTTWQPERLLWNTFNFGSANTIRDDQFKIDAGGYNPLLGRSYGEIAAESRSQHKSQGFGVSASRGIQYEYFVNLKGSAPKDHLFDGVDVSWSRINQPSISGTIEKIQNDFSFKRPEKSVPALLELFTTLKNLPESAWKNQKISELKEIIIACSGLFAEAFTRNRFAIQGNDFQLFFSATNRLSLPVTVEQLSFLSSSLGEFKSLTNGETVQKQFTVKLSDTIPLSQPYWLRDEMQPGTFAVAHQTLIGKPENDPLSVDVVFNFGGVKIPYRLPVHYKVNDPVKGEVNQPLFVVPPVEIRSSPEIALSKGNASVVLSTSVTENDSTVRLNGIVSDHSGGIKKSPGGFEVSGRNQTENIAFSAETNRGTFDQYRVVIEYPHIPDIIRFSKAESKVVGADLKTSGKTAGYISGAGDKIPEALQQLGYQVTTLDKDDVNYDQLKKFDVIVTGVRAYNIHDWLDAAHVSLMNYVKNGGVLFVQYNTNSNLGPIKAKIGPYPFDISRTRVTDENSMVSFVDARNGLLQYPNKITGDDFNGWIQERSIYHAADYGKQYKTLFSMHDANEKPDEGAVIYADYGKGRFVYSGMVFFRQLPAGNPGAYRLFSNLIAKPKTNP